MSTEQLKQRLTFTHWTTDIIRYSDLDPNGHVNNGAINSYFENARVRFRQRLEGTLPQEVLTGFIVVKYTIEFHAMLYFPGEVDVGTKVTRIGNSSYTLGQGIFGEQGCVATAEVVTVNLDSATGRAAPLSESFKAALGAP